MAPRKYNLEDLNLPFGASNLTRPLSEEEAQVIQELLAADIETAGGKESYNKKAQQAYKTYQENKKKQKRIQTAKDVGETVLDFTPVVGDIKGLTYDPYVAYKDAGGGLRGIGYGGLTAGLGLIGLIPGFGDAVAKVGRHTLKTINKKVNKAVSNGLLRTDLGTTFSRPFQKKGYSKSSELDKVIKDNDNFWSDTDFLQYDDYIARNGYGSYGITYGNTGDIYVILPKYNKLLKNTTNRKLKGTLYHELVHRNSRHALDNGETLTTFTGRTMPNGKSAYYEPNMKKLVELEGYNTMNFPMLKNSGYWNGSPEEFLAEYANLASRGYVHNGKITNVGKRTLAGRFDLTTSQVNDVANLLIKNNELQYINYFRPTKYKNKELIFDMIDGYAPEIKNAAVASTIIGTPALGLGMALNEYYNGNKKYGE